MRHGELIALRDLLEANGIPAMIQSDDTGRMLTPLLTRGQSLWIYIDNQEDEARALLEDPEHVVANPVDVEAFYEGVLVATDGEGAVQFRSPESEGKLNLTVDPRPCTIEVQRSGDVVLTSGDALLGEKTKGPKDKDDGDEIKIELEFTNNGIGGYEDAEGEVEYEVSDDEIEFEVEVEEEIFVVTSFALRFC